jgi:hypothetical membrane protein
VPFSGGRPDVVNARHSDAQLMALYARDTATKRLGLARLAGVCGLLAFVTFNAGWVAADLAQPQAFSPANDDISDLGALTASSPWLYNQLAANLSGLLVIALGVGVWLALSPSRLGRVGAAAVIAAGAGTFLDGIFRLDCQGIDVACTNSSWHSHAHKIESASTVGATFIAFLALALALRRTATWRDTWIPVLAALPSIFVANIAFSSIGDGAATRAGTVVVFSALGFLGLRLVQRAGCVATCDATQVLERERRDSNPRPPA